MPDGGSPTTSGTRPFPGVSKSEYIVEISISEGHTWLGGGEGRGSPSPLSHSAGADLVLHGPILKCGSKMLHPSELALLKSRWLLAGFAPKNLSQERSIRIYGGMFELGRFWA